MTVMITSRKDFSSVYCWLQQIRHRTKEDQTVSHTNHWSSSRIDLSIAQLSLLWNKCGIEHSYPIMSFFCSQFCPCSPLLTGINILSSERCSGPPWFGPCLVFSPHCFFLHSNVTKFIYWFSRTLSSFTPLSNWLCFFNLRVLIQTLLCLWSFFQLVQT